MTPPARFARKTTSLASPHIGALLFRTMAAASRPQLNTVQAIWNHVSHSDLTNRYARIYFSAARWSGQSLTYQYFHTLLSLGAP